MSEYPAGTVAKVTMTHTSNSHQDVYERCLWDECNEEWVSGDSGRLYPSEMFNLMVEPLVVLDPDDAKACLTGLEMALEAVESVTSRIHIEAVARRIKAQTKPPRIPEPGWGAVVEAANEGNPRGQWIRADKLGLGWFSAEHGWESWDCLKDPVLMRDGVSD